MTSSYPVIKGSLQFSEKYTWNTADSVGRGASAVVFLGRHKVRGTVVAIKVFHDYVALGYKQDDLRELEMLRQLEHPNIIRLLDIEKETTSQRAVLVMEYCEGGSLHHMLDQPMYYYGLPESEYLLVLHHVAAGMSYLRDRKVIHRDIKPGNIMRYLGTDGFSVYKLTDFGAARSLEDEEHFMSLYGTEEYLHPGIYERAVLKLPTAQSFDAKVDLWSLGVTFYHTATGQLPFQPFGGRQNRQTMFEIITQKGSGVISAVQTFQNGPIQERRDLPETSLLSSGLKSIVVPLLAGLMEPSASKMISYDAFFKIVENVKQKTTVSVFHFSRCEDLKVYADPTITLPGLQDLIASLTDISATDQILLVGGHCLDQVVDPMCALQDYPPRLLVDSIYLFQKEMSDATRLKKPEIPKFPDFPSYSDMDADARLAHSCAARAELIKKFHKNVLEQQQKLMDGLLQFRMYVETRLNSTKTNQEFMCQLMDDCQVHFNMFFDLARILRDRVREPGKLATVEEVVQDKVIRQVHKKATERITEIEQYRDALVKKVEEVKEFFRKICPVCRDEKCLEKVTHHTTMISGVLSRFRRDRSVKQQMSPHDENIHKFERQKLQIHCVSLASIFSDHCFKQLETVYKSTSFACDSLTKCLGRVVKIEKNINSVLNCQKQLIQKLVKHREKMSIAFVKDSGFGSDKTTSTTSSWHGFVAREGLMETPHPASDPTAYRDRGNVGAAPHYWTSSMPSHVLDLREKVLQLQTELSINSQIIKGLEEPLQSLSSYSQPVDIAEYVHGSYSKPVDMAEYVHGLMEKSSSTLAAPYNTNAHMYYTYTTPTVPFCTAPGIPSNSISGSSDFVAEFRSPRRSVPSQKQQLTDPKVIGQGLGTSLKTLTTDTPATFKYSSPSDFVAEFRGGRKNTPSPKHELTNPKIAVGGENSYVTIPCDGNQDCQMSGSGYLHAGMSVASRGFTQAQNAENLPNLVMSMHSATIDDSVNKSCNSLVTPICRTSSQTDFVAESSHSSIESNERVDTSVERH